MTEAHLFLGDCRELLDPALIDTTPPDKLPWSVFPPPEEGIACVCTDPPYGVGYKSTYGKNPIAREKYQQEIEDDESAEVAVANFDTMLELLVPHLSDECEFYVFSNWTVAPYWQNYLDDLSKHGIRLMQLIIWEKGWPGLGDFTYNWGQGHEFIYYLKRGNRPVPYRRSAVIHVDKVLPGTNIHPTEKPTGLLSTLIEYSTIPGQYVFDPYAGSASTLVAARDCGRPSIGIEKNPGYYRDAKRRLADVGLFNL